MSKYKLTCLTPVHIGTDKLINPIDWVLSKDNTILHIIDQNKVLKLAEDNLRLRSEYINLISQPQKGLEGFIQRYSLNLNEITKHTIQFNMGTNLNEIKEIKMILRDGKNNQPYIPGTSLKGAIRSCFLNLMLHESYPEGKDIDLNKIGKIVKRDFNQNLKYTFYDKNLIADVFGKLNSDFNVDFFRYLQVGDSLFGENDTTIKKVIGKTIHGYNKKFYWDHKTNGNNTLINFVECLSVGTVANCTIKFIDELLKNKSNPNKYTQVLHQNVFKIDENNFLKKINEATSNIIKTELDNLYKFKDNTEIKNYEDILSYTNYLDGLIQKIENSNNQFAIIRVGANTGYDSITGGWRQKLNEEASTKLFTKLKKTGHPFEYPKTKRYINNGIPIGFLKIENVL